MPQRPPPPARPVNEAALPGLARWAAELASTAQPTAVLVAGISPVPVGCSVVDAPAPMVAAVGPSLALVATVDPGSGLASWTAELEAVRAAVAGLDLPGDSVPLVAAALEHATSADPRTTAAVVAGIETAVGSQRAAVAGRIHDGMVQDLTAARLLADSALEETGPGPAREQLEAALRALRAAVDSSRVLMAELAPGRGA